MIISFDIQYDLVPVIGQYTISIDLRRFDDFINYVAIDSSGDIYGYSLPVEIDIYNWKPIGDNNGDIQLMGNVCSNVLNWRKLMLKVNRI